MELTKTQLNYISAIKRLTGGQVSLTGISEYLGVRKPTASVALKKLEESGYVIKTSGSESSEYRLTEKAENILAGLEREKIEFMLLFNKRLGINYDECDREYARLSGLFSKSFIERLCEARKSGYKERPEEPDRFSGMGHGMYRVPFRVAHRGGGMRSMGDKGFIHPAVLVIEADRQEVLLESKVIYYRSKNGESLRGALSELSYSADGEVWVKSETSGNNTWRIPLGSVRCGFDALGRLTEGIVMIRARATTVKMPVSEAEITFNFELSEKINLK